MAVGKTGRLEADLGGLEETGWLRRWVRILGRLLGLGSTRDGGQREQHMALGLEKRTVS